VIDDFLTELDAHLRVPSRARVRILAEVRDHLDDSVEHLRASDPRSASTVDAAIQAFGPAAMVATQFNAAAGTRAMRRGTAVAFAAGIAVAAGFLVAAVTQPHPQTASGASFAVQASFFGAALAFQVALVAGARGASRVCAVGRSAAATIEDRLLVRRCAIICVGALGVASVGWATCVGLAARSLVHPNRVTLLVGATLMIGAVALAVALLAKLDVNPFAETTDERNPRPGIALLGERTVTIVQQHPVVPCAALAALAALAAMSHAETTAVGSLPWGLLQAAAVVLGFVVLGPSLGLREQRTTSRSATA
jgi:hypothetical protein